MDVRDYARRRWPPGATYVSAVSRTWRVLTDSEFSTASPPRDVDRPAWGQLAMAATILVVDDEGDLVAAVEYALQREGFRTISAGTARDALVAAAREPGPDLVLLDLMLPDGSGTEVCKQL